MPAKGPPPFDPNAKYRLRLGPRHELVSEEIEILKRLSDAVTERTSRDATPAERRAAGAELVQEDAELAALVDRLEELSEANDESVARTLASLARKEEGIEDDEECPPLY